MTGVISEYRKLEFKQVFIKEDPYNIQNLCQKMEQLIEEPKKKQYEEYEL